ncbi:MAG TPA: hypothetical protein VF469_27825 [Kofleriaceae bacterium]
MLQATPEKPDVPGCVRCGRARTSPAVRKAFLPLSSAVLATLGSAAGSGLLASDAAAQVAARRDDDDSPPPLLVAPANAANPILLAGHRSHQSHQSHHSSSGVGRSRSPAENGAPDDPDSPPPPRPKPAQVVLVAYPGGKIFVDDKPAGQDQTTTLTLEPGSHKVRVVNRFLGEITTTVEVGEGQTGSIPIHW